MFVHGWRHDANVCDANLACFRELARRIALDQRAAASSGPGARPRPVTGVYVGWRGLSKKVWPLEQLSFVSRKNAALRVGSGDMTELLTRLDRVRVELNAAKKDPSRLVVVGSETDSATTTWFPFGQWVATVFEKTRDAQERTALHTAIGNYLPFVTHRLERADLPPGEEGPRAPAPHVAGCVCELPRGSLPMDDLRAMLTAAGAPRAAAVEGTDEGWGPTPCRPERLLGPLKLTCTRPGARRGNPFWVVRASPNVLHEHGGFFSPYFVELVRRLLFEATAGPATPEDPAMPPR